MALISQANKQPTRRLGSIADWLFKSKPQSTQTSSLYKLGTQTPASPVGLANKMLSKSPEPRNLVPGTTMGPKNYAPAPDVAANLNAGQFNLGAYAQQNKLTPTKPAVRPVVQNTSATSPKPVSDARQKFASGVVAPDTGFQSKLDPTDPAAIGGAAMANRPPSPTMTPIANGLGTSQPVPTTLPVPTQPPPQVPDAYKTAYQDYISSLGTSKNVTEAKQKYLDFIKQRDLGLQEIADKRIPLRFVTGQQESVQRLAGIEGARLAGDVEMAQDEQTAAQEASKARLGYEQSLIEREEAKTKPIEIGGRLVDPSTGRVVYEPPKEVDGSKTFTLSPGQKVYDAAGNIIAQNDSDVDKLTEVSPGATVIDAKGNVIFRAPEKGAGEGSNYGDTTAQRTVGLIDQALPNISAKTTGILGATTSKIPGTDAYNLARILESIKANIGFSELQAMRDASKTGGALGQIAVQELNFLQSVLGSLDIGQSTPVLKKNLEDIKASLGRWNQAAEGGAGGDFSW